MPILFRNGFTVDADRVASSMALNEGEAIRDRGLLIKCAIALTAVFTRFSEHSLLHIAPSIVALSGAGVLVLISGVPQNDYPSTVEWETLLFFAGLLVMIGALVKTGVIEDLLASPWMPPATTPWWRPGCYCSSRRYCPAASTTSPMSSR